MGDLATTAPPSCRPSTRQRRSGTPASWGNTMIEYLEAEKQSSNWSIPRRKLEFLSLTSITSIRLTTTRKWGTIQAYEKAFPHAAGRPRDSRPLARDRANLAAFMESIKKRRKTTASNACSPGGWPRRVSVIFRFRPPTSGTSMESWSPATRKMPARSIRPIAGLLTDLKQTRPLGRHPGRLGEVNSGRTPIVQGSTDIKVAGRDHNPQGFTMWMAGGGVKGGFKYGRLMSTGYYAAENRVHMHDLHATLAAFDGYRPHPADLSLLRAGFPGLLTSMAGSFRISLLEPVTCGSLIS